MTAVLFSIRLGTIVVSHRASVRVAGRGLSQLAALSALVALSCLYGCGGDGGSGSGFSGGHGSGNPLPPTPTPAPLPQTIGDVTTLLSDVGEVTISGIVWDSTDGSLVEMDGIKPGPTVLYGNEITLAPANITIAGLSYPSGITYNSTNHTFYFTQQDAIYATSKTAKTATVFASVGLTMPSCITIDPSGNLYVFDVDHIDKVSPGGVVTRVTPSGSFPIEPPGSNQALTFDTANGALYYSDPQSDVVWMVTTSGTVSVLAGQCFSSLTGTGCVPGEVLGTGAGAVLASPAGIAYDSNDNVLIMGDVGNHVLWRITPSGEASVVAGYGPGTSIDGNGLRAFLFLPQTLAFNPAAGLVYFLEGTTASGLNLRTYATDGLSQPSFTMPVQRYPLADPRYLTEYPSTAPDGSIWFLQGTGTANTTIYVDHETEGGTVTRYPVPSGYGVNFDDGATRSVIDAQGNYWFIAAGAGVYNLGVIQVTPNGTFTYYQIKTLQPNTTDGGPSDIIRGPDGNLWFAEYGLYGTSIGTIANGTTHQYWVTNNDGVANPLTQYDSPIVAGPDGNIWYAEGAEFGRMTPSGALLSPISVPESGITLPTPDDAGNIWYFCNSDLEGTSDVCRLSATGYAVSSFSMGANENCTPYGLALASNGVAWFPSCDTITISSMTQSGTVTTYIMPYEQGAGSGTAVSPDGNVWVTSFFSQTFLLNPAEYASAGLPIYEPDMRPRGHPRAANGRRGASSHAR